jgi:hypothetical protein
VNRYLQRLARRVLGEGVSQAGERYPRLTMSDFRHSSACYWLRRYKSEAALKYRFGWKKTEQIHAYTRLLGMQDNITEDDLLVDARRTDLEWQLERAEGEKKLMQGQIDAMKAQLAQVLDVVSAMGRKIA